MLIRFLRFLITVVILYGIGLALLGLYGSLGQFTGGIADIWGVNAGLGLAGAQISEAPASPSIPETGDLRAPPLLTPTPFLPVAPTWTPVPTNPPAQPAANNPQPAAGNPQPAAPEPATATPQPAPTFTRTPRPVGAPDRIVIDKIGLDAPVVIAPRLELRLGHDVFENWQPPNYFAAGWSEGSAMLGEKGNTVMSGHHNIDGMVFGQLVNLERGDRITVYSNGAPYHYVVSQVMKFEERFAPIEQRVENGRWLAPSDDERLTLVTCWPPQSNTYRLIVVAVPAD